MLSKEQEDEWSVATVDAISNVAGNKKKLNYRSAYSL